MYILYFKPSIGVLLYGYSTLYIISLTQVHSNHQVMDKKILPAMYAPFSVLLEQTSKPGQIKYWEEKSYTSNKFKTAR